MVKEVGDMTTLEYVFPPNHNNTQWISADAFQNLSVNPQAPNVAVLSFQAIDSLHGTSFVCQASTPNGNHVYKYYRLLTCGNYYSMIVTIQMVHDYILEVHGHQV